MKIAIKYYGVPDDRLVVQAFPCGVPGLAIHARHNAPGFALTHIRSGLSVASFPDADPEAVLAAAHALAALTDWTTSASDIADEVTGHEVLAVAERYGADRFSIRTSIDLADVAEVTGCP